MSLLSNVTDNVLSAHKIIKSTFLRIYKMLGLVEIGHLKHDRRTIWRKTVFLFRLQFPCSCMLIMFKTFKNKILTHNDIKQNTQYCTKWRSLVSQIVVITIRVDKLAHLETQGLILCRNISSSQDISELYKYLNFLLCISFIWELLSFKISCPFSLPLCFFC